MMTGYYTSDTWSCWQTTTSTSTDVWTSWNDTGTSTTTDTATWTYWVTDSSTTPAYEVRPSSQAVWTTWSSCTPVVLETEEQKAARRARADEAERLAKERVKKAAEAEVKSRELLESLLDEEQKADLKKDHCVLVEVKSGRKYRIRKGHTGNIECLTPDGKRVAEKLCVHTGLDIPAYDNMAAQLLWLHWNEDALRRKANITRLAA